MNNIDRQYKELLEHILRFGVSKSDRTGTGTKSLFGWQIRHRMEEGFPLLTTKKMYTKGIITELLWFLRGDTNIKYLVDNDCHIWDGDAYKNWVFKNSEPDQYWLTKEEFINRIKTDDEFAYEWGELGPIYGRQWRSWEVNEPKEVLKTEDVTWPYEPNPHTYQQRVGTFKVRQIDQIANLISELKTNPDSRRLMVNAWNVGELDQMVLPPCHYGFQVYTRELSMDEKINLLSAKKDLNDFDTLTLEEKLKNGPQRAISLMYNARSQDVPLGTPFNIASYALLLEIIAKTVNMVPDELITNMGDCHIYLNQIDGIKEQITRSSYKLPTLKHMKTDEFYKSLSEDLSLITHLDPKDFKIEGYQSHPTIKMPLSN